LLPEEGGALLCCGPDTIHGVSFIDEAVLYHVADCADVMDVFEWVLVEDHEIREFSFLDTADIVLKTEVCCAVVSCGPQNLMRCQTAFGE